jgi:hypothetical protein
VDWRFCSHSKEPDLQGEALSSNPIPRRRRRGGGGGEGEGGEGEGEGEGEEEGKDNT